MKMRAVWELVEMTIIPIITYGSEGWNLTKGEREQLQTIFNKALKDILKIPQGTPTQILLGETGFQPIDLIINKKRIMQNARMEKMDNSKLVKVITNENDSKWKKETQELMDQYNLDSETLTNKTILKRKLQEENCRKHEEQIQEEAQNK